MLTQSSIGEAYGSLNGMNACSEHERTANNKESNLEIIGKWFRGWKSFILLIIVQSKKYRSHKLMTTN